jgi:hypothetical protein
MAALLRVVARHPVLMFIVIGLGAGFLTAAIRPIADADVLPYGLPRHGFLEGLLASVSVPYWLPERSRDTTTLLILLGAVCAGEFPREESCYRSTKSVDREVHRGHMSSWVGIAVHAHRVWSRTLRRTLPSRLCRRPSWPGGWASHLDVRAAP